MNLEQAKAHIDAATAATVQQLELNKASLTNHLDAADRIIMRKAAETVLEIAKVPDPTQ